MTAGAGTTTTFAVPRVVVTADGGTRFDEALVTLQGTGPALRGRPAHVLSAGFVTVNAEWNPVCHVAPRRQFVVVLAGRVDIECTDGEVRRFGPGGILLVEDTVGRGHVFRVVEGPVRCMNLPLSDDELFGETDD
jgi:hypothetical protein